MKSPRIVTRSEWLAERKRLLQEEKDFTYRRDALSEKRRALPMVKVDKTYVFDSPEGKKTLLDLFQGRKQVIIYHFMFDPSWDEGCKSCSFVADNYAGSIVHLGARDTAFVTVSRAPLPKIEAFRKRMGWTFPWVSSNGNDFNYDFHVTLDADAGSVEYNYEKTSKLVEEGEMPSTKGEMPGVSVFLRDGDEIYHTYSTYQRGLDLLINTYNYLDLTPLGRQEKEGYGMAWLRLHDQY